MAGGAWSRVTLPHWTHDDNHGDVRPGVDLSRFFHRQKDTSSSSPLNNTLILDSVTPSWDKMTSSWQNVTSSSVKVTLPDTYPWAVGFGSTWVAIGVSGIISNGLLLLMALSKDLRVTSYGVCLAALAVLHVLLLGGRLLRAWSIYENATSAAQRFQMSAEAVRILEDKDGVGLCAVMAVEHCLRAMEAWMTALLAIDRTLFLCFPLKRMKLCTAKRALLGVIVIVAGCLAIYVPPITMTLIKHHEEGEDLLTGTLPEVRALLSQICTAIADWYRDHVLQNAVFSSLAPILLVVVCCCLLIAEVRSRDRKARQVILAQDCVEQALRRMSQQNRLSMSMVGILVHFVLCVLPQSLLPLVSHGEESRFKSNTTLKNTTEFVHVSEQEVHQTLLRVILSEGLDTLASLNYSDVLWILLASNKFFRRLLYKVVCARRANLDADLSRSNTKQREAIRKRLDDFSKTTSGVIGVKLGWGRWRTARVPPPVVTGASGRMGSTDLNTGYEVTERHDEVSRSFSQESTETILRETATRLSSLPDTYKLF